MLTWMVNGHKQCVVFRTKLINGDWLKRFKNVAIFVVHATSELCDSFYICGLVIFYIFIFSNGIYFWI